MGILTLKYPLQVGKNVISTPGQVWTGHVGYQKVERGEQRIVAQQLTLWCPVREQEVMREYTVYVAMTGERVDASAEYIGTAVSPDGGSFVVHAYLILD